MWQAISLGREGVLARQQGVKNYSKGPDIIFLTVAEHGAVILGDIQLWRYKLVCTTE
jgi:hypothetical protein